MTGPTDHEVPGVEAAERAADIETTATTYEYDDRGHCEAGTAGRAVVGVTDEGGAVLVRRHEETPAVTLPAATVPPGEAFVPAGLEALAAAGVPAAFAGVERVRTVDHVVDGERVDRTRHLVFRANVAPGAVAAPSFDGPWRAAWVESVPEAVAGTEPGADIALFC